MRRKLLIALFAAISLAGQSQEDVWQKCNESQSVDIRIKPIICSDNTHQAGAPVGATQDGSINTLYRSQYRGEKYDVSPENPAELTFDFKKVKCIDYLEYVPPQRDENGMVNEVEIYVKTAADEDYRLYEHCKWTFNHNPKRIVFKGGLHDPISIKFRILKGYGGYALSRLIPLALHRSYPCYGKGLFGELAKGTSGRLVISLTFPPLLRGGMGWGC